MSETEPKDTTLPPEAAFVVQLSAEADGVSVPLAGRAEHVVSGRATRFSTLDELAHFLSACLAPPASGSDGDVAAGDAHEDPGGRPTRRLASKQR